MKKRTINVSDKMQKGYRYRWFEPVGKNFEKGFKPELTPRQMLEMGVFGGKYMTDCSKEFPSSWFENPKLCPEQHDPKLNYFGVNASQALSVWIKKGWIHTDDPRGWFQWYCRYYMGRRIPRKIDAKSGDGKPYSGTLIRSARIAEKAIGFVGRNSARQYFIGLMTAGGYNGRSFCQTKCICQQMPGFFKVPLERRRHS